MKSPAKRKATEGESEHQWWTNRARSFQALSRKREYKKRLKSKKTEHFSSFSNDKAKACFLDSKYWAFILLWEFKLISKFLFPFYSQKTSNLNFRFYNIEANLNRRIYYYTSKFKGQIFAKQLSFYEFEILFRQADPVDKFLNPDWELVN